MVKIGPIRFLGLAKKLLIKILKLESFYFLGSRTTKTVDQDWEAIAACDCEHPSVSVLVSLYKHDQYLDVLIESINSNHCSKIDFQLMFIACSESSIQNTLAKLHPMVRYSVTPFRERASIYQAWNTGVKNSDSEFLTNLNADDLRRPSSICHLSKILGENPAKDVIYGDFILTKKEPLKKWNPQSNLVKTQLGGFELKDLLVKGNNKPHCAPIWRRSLHADLGIFKSDLESSGDSEFWLRCLLANKEFHYEPLTTVAYFLNPEGLSSTWKSRGFREWNEVLNSLKIKQE